MAWSRASFKGQQVWAEVSADGAPIVNGGRIRVRYSDKAGATIYQAGASRVEPSGSAPVEMAEGAAAADNPAPAATPGGAAPAARSGRASGFGSAGSRTAAQAAAAKTAATSQVAAAADAYRCFTDGACTGNPGPAGAGMYLEGPGGEKIERFKALGFSTNNVGELTGIELALDELDALGVAADAAAVVFSDSQYARGVLTQGWKAKANVELIAAIRTRLKARPGVRLQWVAGHVGLPGNEKADALARKGVEASRRR